MTMDKIKQLSGIELLLHPPYSPDLAPSYYYIFRFMAHFLRCRECEKKKWFRQGLNELANDGFKP